MNQILTVILMTILLSVFTNTLVFAEAPPSLSFELPEEDPEEDPEPDPEEETCEANITDDEVNPDAFNPSEGEDTTVKFTTNCDADIELIIVDSSDDTVITLVDDVETSAGDHEFDWDGTETDGDTVESGTYEYKITAKDIDSGDELDTEEGTITVTEEEDSDECNDPITDDEADPAGFNPGNGEETAIKFTLTCSVVIELNIIDSDDKIVVALIDNVEKSATDHSFSWYGTANNSSTGDSVESGTYQYQIIAKDIDSDEEIETEEGSIDRKSVV